MKSTSSPSRALRRVSQHLKAHPDVVRFMTLVRIKGLDWKKLTEEETLRKALMPVADLIKLPKRLRKCLARLTEFITLAGRCIENALAIKEGKLVVDAIVTLKKTGMGAWYKIVGFWDDGLVVIESVSNGGSAKKVSPRELEIAIH